MKRSNVDGREYWLAVKAARVSAGIFAERMADNLRREAKYNGLNGYTPCPTGSGMITHGNGYCLCPVTS